MNPTPRVGRDRWAHRPRILVFPRISRIAVALFLLAAGGHAAEPAHRTDFDIKADEADPALRKLAEQSGQQVIYPTELVQGIKTQRVKGTFTAKEALDQMLAGTTLSSWQDELTGALAIGRGAIPPADQPIELPPFVVSESNEEHWRYASLPGLEVLSRRSDQTTNDLMVQHGVLHELLEIILPKELQFRSEVPTAYLFFNGDDKSEITKDLLDNLEKREKELAAIQGKRWQRLNMSVAVTALPNYRFWDQDSLSIFFLQEDRFNQSGGLRLAPSYVRYLLERRAPALPPWFVHGIADLYQRTAMAAWSPSFTSDTIDTPFQRYSIVLKPQIWVSAELTQAILKRPRAQVEMLSLSELFADRQVIRHRLAPLGLDGQDEDLVRNGVVRLPDFVVGASQLPKVQAEYFENLRRSEVELFIRWMLDGDKPGRRRALWKFAARASTEPVTEDLFKDCIGLDYASAEHEFQAFVRTACRGEVILHPAKIPEAAQLELRDATLAEVSRIKGDFNRLEIPYVRQLYPAMTGKYVEQARRTLRRAYNEGDRDPRLLAEIGLCECDAGNDAGAVPFLERAMHDKQVRLRACFELARIRFDALRTAVGSGGKLTPVQLTTVLEPLFRLRGRAPALAEAYDLMAEAWLRCEARPTQEQLDYLAEGPRIFPRRPRLILSVALLNFSSGNLHEATRLVEQGLRVTEDSTGRESLEQLRVAIVESREAGR